MLDPTSTGAWIVAAITSGMAVFERTRSAKITKKTDIENETLSLAKAAQARADMLQSIADDYKKLLEKERLEHKATRDFWHTENGNNQALLATANLKVMELQDRPDLRDILSVLKAQGEGIKEILLLISRQHN